MEWLKWPLKCSLNDGCWCPSSECVRMCLCASVCVPAPDPVSIGDAKFLSPTHLPTDHSPRYQTSTPTSWCSPHLPQWSHSFLLVCVLLSLFPSASASLSTLWGKTQLPPHTHKIMATICLSHEHRCVNKWESRLIAETKPYHLGWKLCFPKHHKSTEQRCFLFCPGQS